MACSTSRVADKFAVKSFIFTPIDPTHINTISFLNHKLLPPPLSELTRFRKINQTHHTINDQIFAFFLLIPASSATFPSTAAPQRTTLLGWRPSLSLLIITLTDGITTCGARLAVPLQATIVGGVCRSRCCYYTCGLVVGLPRLVSRLMSPEE